MVGWIVGHDHNRQKLHSASNLTKLVPACQLSVDDEGAPNTDQCTDHPSKSKNMDLGARSTRSAGQTADQFDDGEGE